MQNELILAEKLIRSLRKDKQKLHEALRDAIDKKEMMHKSALEYKKVRDKEREKNEYLFTNLKEKDKALKSLDYCKQQLKNKDKHIEELLQKVKDLEESVAEITVENLS